MPVGGQLELRCEATGNPKPIIYLLKDVNYVPELDHGNGTTERRVKTITSAKKSDAGVYVCMAFNTLVGPPEGMREITDWKRIIVKVNGKTVYTVIIASSVPVCRASVCNTKKMHAMACMIVTLQQYIFIFFLTFHSHFRKPESRCQQNSVSTLRYLL